MRTTWMAWTALAFAASVWHLLIDAQIGLLGPTSDVMTFSQGLALLLDAALIGWWLYVGFGAARGEAGALGALALLVLLEPVLFDGIVAFAVAPPPSAAFPYQDLAHTASLLFGVVCLVSMRRSVGWGRWGWQAWVALALKFVGSLVGASVFFTLAV